MDNREKRCYCKEWMGMKKVRSRLLVHWGPDVWFICNKAVFAAVEQSDYPAFGVPLKHFFAPPNAFR